MRLSATIRVERLFLALALCTIVTVVAGAVADVVLMRYPGPATRETLHRWSLMRDASIPTWLASVQLLACAAALALSAKEAAHRDARSSGWWLLAAIFCLMSLDEVAMIHELSGILLRRLVPASRELGGVFFYSWTLLAIPGVLLLGLSLLRWFVSLPNRIRLQFGLAALLFLSGALGMEMFNASLEAAHEDRVRYALFTALEEALEFAGTLFFLYALIDRLRRLDTSLTIAFRQAA